MTRHFCCKLTALQDTSNGSCTSQSKAIRQSSTTMDTSNGSCTSQSTPIHQSSTTMMPPKVTRTLAIQVRTKCRSVSTQTRPQTRSAYVQVNTAIRQSLAVQTDISATGDAWDLLDRLHGTSSPISEQVPLPSEFLDSIHVEREGPVPLASSEPAGLCEKDDTFGDCGDCPASPTSPPSSEPPSMCQNDDPTYDPTYDSTHEPSYDNSFEMDDEETEQGHSRGENKYIVYESCLLECFRLCVTCYAPSKPSLHLSGSCLTVTTLCPKKHSHTWSSQPYVGRKPVGNVDIASVLLFSGSSPAPALRMMRLMNIRVISERRFHDYQQAYLLPAVQTVWDRQRDEDLTALVGEPVDLSGDGRCDSPGHSTKYMTYSFYSHRLGKIVHTELVQVKECPEVSASSNMEKEGCVRGIAFLKSKNILIRSFTTDRHSSIKAYMRIHQPTILHLFDVWHAVKGIRKKLAAGSKCAGCKDLAPWVSTVCNHLWWCASASGGNGELLAAAWSSVTNHVCNIHTGHSLLYPRCLHKDAGDKQWIVPGSPAHTKLKAIANAPLFAKDVKQLSPNAQTYGLESFHNVLNGFAPKSTAFSYEGMAARTMIAILHFNENSSRLQAVTNEGQEQWHIKSPKAQKGATTVYPRMTAVTFEYVDRLHEEVLERCKTYPTFKEALAEKTPKVPPAFVSPGPRPSKEELVSAHRRRFAKPSLEGDGKTRMNMSLSAYVECGLDKSGAFCQAMKIVYMEQ
uniref:Putative crack-1 is transposable element n=1 Tax=Ixodes ricinus TaxID=34613 RepID=A0A6B0VFU9_IXORI